MSISVHKIDERVEAVYFTRDSLIVDLMDGRSISVPLTWYPRLMKATPQNRAHWEICGGGYGIHWPEIDEDLSTEGLLRGAPAPCVTKTSVAKKSKSPKTIHSRSLKRRVKQNS
jgi:Protein of unknown function (DUF2442)